MKERLITLLLAVAALLLFYTLLFPKPVSQTQQLSQPLSTDGRADGQLAIWRWLQTEHIPVSSLRYRYDHLLPPSGAAIGAGNVLITSLPHKFPIRTDEWASITRWIGAGNTVIVLAALDDTPAWSLGIEASMLNELKALTGLSFSAAVAKTKPGMSADPKSLRQGLKEMLATGDLSLEPRGEHPLLAQVQKVHGASDFPAGRWHATPQLQAMPLVLLQRTDAGTAALWLVHSGEGQLIVSSLASPFSNSQIDRDDNARLLSNVIAWSRSPQGSVIFDDVHQGLTSYYDAHAFFADPRLHRTIWWILLLWLAFVLGPLPLRSAFSPWKPLDETALIEASSRFYSAALAPGEAAHRLFANFFNVLRRKLNLPQNGAPLWEWLKTQSKVSDDERARLQVLFSQVHAGERVKLIALQSLLSDIQGKVA